MDNGYQYIRILREFTVPQSINSSTNLHWMKVVGYVPEGRRGSVAVDVRVSLSRLSYGGDVARPYSGETGQRSCTYNID